MNKIFIGLILSLILSLITIHFTKADACCALTSCYIDSFCFSGVFNCGGYIPCTCTSDCCPYMSCGCCPTTTTIRPSTTTTTTTTTTTIPSNLCSPGQCGPCEDCYGYSNIDCGPCTRCIGEQIPSCQPDNSCTCQGTGCSSGWVCINGICQQESAEKQCRANAGNCNGYLDVQGVCQVNEPSGVPSGYAWQVEFSCSAYQRKAWCYAHPSCWDVCGNDAGYACGVENSNLKAYRNQMCKFDNGQKKCIVVSNSACDHPINVDYGWTNVKTSSADVHIKVSSDISYSGKITFVIRKNVVLGKDLCCYLDGTCNNDASYLGNCPSQYYYTAMSPVGKGGEYTATFTAKVEGDYHFDVWYEGHHYSPTDNVHLKPTTTTTTLPNCQEGQCGPCNNCLGAQGTNCGECKSCFQPPSAPPTCRVDDTCTCSSCYDSTPPNTGSCVCRSGSCVEYCNEECMERGLIYVGCKCRPREKGLVYLDTGNCEQSCSLLNQPRECACTVNESCGAPCPDASGSIKYCNSDERCKFVQTGTGTSDYSGYGECVADASCVPTNPCSGKADGTSCSVNGQSGICCNQQCSTNGANYNPATGKCVETNCSDDSDNDNDGSKDCLDPDCCGKVKSGNIICCTPPAGKSADQCCADAGRKTACDTTAHQCYQTCSSNQECQQGYCCTDDPKGPGNRKFECVDRGIYSENNQYLCDPPGWETEEKQDLSRIPLLFFSSFNPFA